MYIYIYIYIYTYTHIHGHTERPHPQKSDLILLRCLLSVIRIITNMIVSNHTITSMIISIVSSIHISIISVISSSS